MVRLVLVLGRACSCLSYRTFPTHVINLEAAPLHALAVLVADLAHGSRSRELSR